MLFVVTSPFIDHCTVLRGEEKQCFVNVMYQLSKKTSKTTFQLLEIYGTVSKLLHKSHITTRWQ